jgi:hypothetical protein
MLNRNAVVPADGALDPAAAGPFPAGHEYRDLSLRQKLNGLGKAKHGHAPFAGKIRGRGERAVKDSPPLASISATSAARSAFICPMALPLMGWEMKNFVMAFAPFPL